MWSVCVWEELWLWIWLWICLCVFSCSVQEAGLEKVRSSMTCSSTYYMHVYYLTASMCSKCFNERWEGRKKKAGKVKQTTRRSNTTHPCTLHDYRNMYILDYKYVHVHNYTSMYTCTLCSATREIWGSHIQQTHLHGGRWVGGGVRGERGRRNYMVPHAV